MARRALSCLTAAGLLLVSCGNAPGAPPIDGTVSFRCLWWSEAQMENLNPNAPPPKNTEVTIQKWEYSDPVAVPHPDKIDAVLALQSSAGHDGLEVFVSTQWRTGKMSAKNAPWGTQFPERKIATASLLAGTKKEIRAPIDLKAQMDALEKQKLWPHTLRVTFTVRKAGAAAPLLVRTADLPITPGD